MRRDDLAPASAMIVSALVGAAVWALLLSIIL